MKKKVRQKLEKEKRRVERRQRQPAPATRLGSHKVRYELSERSQAIAQGGLGAVLNLERRLGLAREIDARVRVLQATRVYNESEHILTIAHNLLCGGRSLDDVEHLRRDTAMLDALAMQRLPAPSTLGDYCRRFDVARIAGLNGALNAVRARVWRQAGIAKGQAIIDGDGTIVETNGESKELTGLSYKGLWGYQPLLLSLANTQEPLFIVTAPPIVRPMRVPPPTSTKRLRSACRQAFPASFSEATRTSPRRRIWTAGMMLVTLLSLDMTPS